MTSTVRAAPARRFSELGRNVASRLLDEKYGLPIGLLAVHVVLGFLMALSPAVSTAHAVMTALVVLWVGLFGRRLEHVALAAGYAAVCDVPWRVTEARFFYEGGKYLVAIVLGAGLVRLVRTTRLAALPIAYFGLMLPSAVLTLIGQGPGRFRDIISFNLSGPLALAVACAFFLQIRMSWVEVRGILLAALGPALTLLTVVTYRETQIDVLTFGSQSDFQTSGGFGPNQVSTALAVGALCCLLLVLTEHRLRPRLLLGAIGLWFFGQGVFTFSRGGLYDLAGAALCILFVALGERSLRWKVLRGALIMTVLSLVVFACLNSITDGALSDRFSSTDSTGRNEIAAGDLDLFYDNPLAGVGPGMAQYSREGKRASAHTEFSRMLAEHGVLGLAALGILVALILSAVTVAPTVWGRAVSLSLTAFAALAMTNTAMRITAPAFLFGLGMTRIGPTRRSPGRVRTRPKVAVPDPSRFDVDELTRPRSWS